MKKSLIAGNWKMYKAPNESVEFVKILAKNIRTYDDRDILICPPFTSLFPVSEVLSKQKSLKLGAQNVSPEDEGAFTGEVSTAMLKETGVEYVICGHSERRNIFGESNSVVNKKVKKTASAGMTPILCIGENLEEREIGRTFEVVRSQIKESLDGFEQPDRLAVAYEPVWAIGTGLAATSQQAQEVHARIREVLVGRGFTSHVPLLYGGSVTADNASELFACPDIDGALVGGASLKAEEFAKIVDHARRQPA